MCRGRGMTRVRRADVPRRDAGFSRFVRDVTLKASNRSRMGSVVHVRAVVQFFADVRHVPQYQNQPLELPGVLDCRSRRLPTMSVSAF